MPRGGARPGAGRKPGEVNEHSLAKQANRERVRQRAEQHLDRVVDKVAEHACGVSYMRLRHPDGSFARATDEKQIDAAIALGAKWCEIFTESPNTSAAQLIIGYAADKPIEPHEITGADGGPVRVIVELPE